MSDKKLTPQERKDITKDLRKKHQPYFDSMGISDAIFIPKMAHFVRDLEGKHIGFFDNELEHGEDIYTEMVSKHLEPEDPNRRLIKVRYNPHFKEEYATSDPLPSGSVRYFIPLDEMEFIEEKEESEFGIADPLEDPLVSEMTLRDLAAILLKEPVSNRGWLNEIINKYK